MVVSIEIVTEACRSQPTGLATESTTKAGKNIFLGSSLRCLDHSLTGNQQNIIKYKTAAGAENSLVCLQPWTIFLLTTENYIDSIPMIN